MFDSDYRQSSSLPRLPTSTRVLRLIDFFTLSLVERIIRTAPEITVYGAEARKHTARIIDRHIQRDRHGDLPTVSRTVSTDLPVCIPPVHAVRAPVDAKSTISSLVSLGLLNASQR